MQKKYSWLILSTNIFLIILLLVTLFQKSDISNLSNNSSEASLPIILEHLRPGVVGLFSDQSDFYAWEEPNDNQQTLTQKKESHIGWTAFFIDANGYLLTSKHVVENGDVYLAVLDDGSSLKIDKIWLHPILDLAILHIDNPLHKRFSVPNIKQELDAIKIWEASFTLWTPFSKYINTLSAGILSATGRMLNIEWDKVYSGLYQLDMNINPGNSWGPLFDKNWEIFGVITAISSQNSHIWFALPITQKLISTFLIDIQKNPLIKTISPTH